MLQEWRKTWTLKGLSSSIAGYARSQNFLQCACFYHLDLPVLNTSRAWPAVPASGSSTTVLLRTRSHFMSIINSVSIFTWIHQTTPATPILGREPHGSRYLSTLPQLPSCLHWGSCFFPVPSCTGNPEVHGESGKFPPRHEVELFCLQPDKEEGPINWISCM